MYIDWTYIVLVLPAVLLSLWASSNVKSTYARYAKVFNARGITGAEAARRVLEKARELSPQVILCVGQAGGRDAVTPEVIGINLREASIPDNAGVACAGTPIDPDGPDGTFSTLPVREMAEAIRAQGIPSRLSYSAGAYVCNDLMYTLLNHFRGTDTRVGFVHVPYIPSQGSPSLPQAQLTQALTAAIEAL